MSRTGTPKSQQIDYLVLVCVLELGISGCGTTYLYQTGKQAQLNDRVMVHVLAEGVRKGHLQQLNPTAQEALLERDQELNSSSLEASLKQLQEDDSIDPGVSYTFRTGMSVEEVKRLAGEPITTQKSKSASYDEILEYDFALLYFKRNKLRDLVFKEKKGNRRRPEWGIRGTGYSNEP